MRKRKIDPGKMRKLRSGEPNKVPLKAHEENTRKNSRLPNKQPFNPSMKLSENRKTEKNKTQKDTQTGKVK